MERRSDGDKCVPQTVYGHKHSFMVELRIDVLRDVKAMKEHNVDITTVSGTEAKIVKQVSSWRPAGITWVRGEPRAAVLTPNTAANTSDETSLDRAKRDHARAGGTANCLKPKRLEIAYDIEEVIERIGHEAVAENLKQCRDEQSGQEASEFGRARVCLDSSLPKH